VHVAVQDQDRRLQACDPFPVRRGVPGQGGQGGRVVLPRHVTQARERGLNHAGERRFLQGEAERHRSSQRLAHVDETRRVHLPARHERGPRRPRVAMQALLARPARAAPVPAVVEQQDVEAGRGQRAGMVEAMRDVASVAVEEEHVAARGSGAGRDPPAVQPLAVFGRDAQVREGEADVRGIAVELPVGKVDERVDERGPHARERPSSCLTPPPASSVRIHVMRLRWPSRRGILRRLAILGLVVAWLGVATVLETRRLHATLPGGTRGATNVDVGQLVEDVRRLSAPDMEGRRPGTEGNARARAYVVQRLRDEGTAPLGGGYEHPFGFSHTSVKAIWRRDRPVRMDMRGTNVLALIPGSAPGPALVVSAHYDHLGIRGDALYPGADDNASGVAALLAVAHELRGRPPRHPVVLAVFDAEELGLRGSRAFVPGPPAGTPPIGMDLNLDMLSRSDGADLTVSGVGPEPWLRATVEA